MWLQVCLENSICPGYRRRSTGRLFHARYTSCTHMDRLPLLLYVHVGLPVQPTKAAWWPWLLTFWPLKWFPSRLWRGLPLCQIWSSHRPLHSRLRPDVRDRQTSDVRQHHRLMPHGQGIIIIIMGLVKLIKFLNTLACAVVLRIKSHTHTHRERERERDTYTTDPISPRVVA